MNLRQRVRQESGAKPPQVADNTPFRIQEEVILPVLEEEYTTRNGVDLEAPREGGKTGDGVRNGARLDQNRR